MPRIEIDDEVYAELERHVKGFEQPNDVLRRLLLDETDAPASTKARATSRTDVVGRLLPLIESGLIKPDDKLVHHKIRKGITFTATVGINGTVITDAGIYTSPSPALAKLVGSQIDGWTNWTHLPTDKTLKELRDGR